MQVGFLTRSLSRDAGGIFEIETALAKELDKSGCKVTAFGNIDRFTNEDSRAWGLVQTRAYEFFGPDSYRFAPQLRREFLNSDFDICHLHSLWSHTSSIAYKWGELKCRPVVVSPNGMLDPWALAHSAWKKRIVLLLQEKRLLKNAACLHANTEKEAKDFRSLGLGRPIAVISNGVYLPNRLNVDELRAERKGRLKRLLYLGRLHPKKGLVNAISAWGKLHVSMRKSEWQLVIAGWDQNGHLAELKKLCDTLDLSYSDSLTSKNIESPHDIVFLGPTYGRDKEILLSQANAFILPSFSEGMPMSILEAWAFGLPVLLTPFCNLDLGVEHGAAYKIEPTVEGISDGLVFLTDSSSNDLASLGRLGRLLVESQFSWESVAQKMKMVYEWLVVGACTPDFIRIK